MRKSLIFTLITVAMTAGLGLGYAQEMPPEVKAFLDNYTTDSTAPMGPLYAKSRGYFDDSTPIKDLRWRAIQVYNPKDISIDEYPDTVALSEIIEPIPFWHVFIMAYGKPLYKLELSNKDGQPKFITVWLPPSSPGVEFKNDVWVPLLKAYSVSTGINPISIEVLSVTYEAMEAMQSPVRMYGGFVIDRFFYFKQKGPRKIYYIGSNSTGRTDSLRRAVFTASLETLDDSKNLVKLWKNIWKQILNKGNKGKNSTDERVKLKKSNDVDKRDSVVWKEVPRMNIRGNSNEEAFKEMRRFRDEKVGGR